MLCWGMRHGAHAVNLFVLSAAKSRALNSRFVEGVERRLPSERERERESGGKTPKALQPAKLNQMRKPQKNIPNPTRKPQPAR